MPDYIDAYAMGTVKYTSKFPVISEFLSTALSIASWIHARI